MAETQIAIGQQGRDNSFFLTIYKNGVALTPTDMSSITKFEIKFNGEYYDSDTYPAGIVPDNSTGTITIYPRVLGLKVSTDHKTELIIYDANHTAGFVWTQFRMKIKGDAIPL